MKTNLFLLVGIVMLSLLGCGGETAVPTPTAAAVAETVVEPEIVVEEETNDCPDYFRFCTHVQISGTLTADFTSGIGGSIPACAEWVASGPAHHLDLPTVQAFEQQPQVVVALTALGEYTGPGRYEMVHTTTGRLPDFFPTLTIGDRTFERGETATAVAEIAADGSGTFTATGLVEITSLQNSNPDPNAQVDLTVMWTCQDVE